PAPAMSMAWDGALPCGVDVSDLASGPFSLLVTATDGHSRGADMRDAAHNSETTLAFGGSCDDGDPCTVDTCNAGVCQHTPVTCGGGDACHEAGTCDHATGACVVAPK